MPTPRVDVLGWAQQQLAPSLSLEQRLTDPDWFGLDTASPLQRAICRWADGEPVDHEQLELDLQRLAEDYPEDIQERMTLDWILGEGVVVTRKPRWIVVLAGIRCGKSLIASCHNVHMSQVVDCSGMRDGELAKIATVSLTLELSKAVLMHLKGTANRSDGIAGVLVGDVKANGVDLLNPSGHVMETRVIYPGRAGGGLVSYWYGGVVFDEAGRMQGEAEAVDNLNHSLKAVEHRILPGGQILFISSPWAPVGPLYDLVQAHYGTPGDVLVIRAPAPAMHPGHWTPERCAKAKESSGDDEQEGSYQMDVLGEWGAPAVQAFPIAEIEACLREAALEPEPGEFYYATMDPATRSDSWTLVIGGIRRATGKPTVYLATQWTKRDGLLIEEIIEQVAELTRKYDVDRVRTDQWSADAIAALGRLESLTVIDETWTQKRKVGAIDDLRIAVKRGRVEFHNAEHFKTDMTAVKRILTRDGVAIDYPRSKGRHCDFAPAVAHWFSLYMERPEVLEEPRTQLQLDFEASRAYKEKVISGALRRGETDENTETMQDDDYLSDEDDLLSWL